MKRLIAILSIVTMVVTQTPEVNARFGCRRATAAQLHAHCKRHGIKLAPVHLAHAHSNTQRKPGATHIAQSTRPAQFRHNLARRQASKVNKAPANKTPLKRTAVQTQFGHGRTQAAKQAQNLEVQRNILSRVTPARVTPVVEPKAAATLDPKVTAKGYSRTAKILGGLGALAAAGALAYAGNHYWNIYTAAASVATAIVVA